MGRTKLDIDIGQRTGRSAATVERHRLKEGMWPAESSADIKRHYEVMDALGLGSGRDNWLIALQAAAQYDWPIVRLRTDLVASSPVIASGTKIDPALSQSSAVFNLVRRFLSTIALGSEAVATEQSFKFPDSAGDIAGGIADDAIAGVGAAVTSQATIPDDFNAFAELVDTMLDRLPGAATEEGPETLSDEPLSMDVHTEMRRLPESMVRSSEWAQTASSRELVHAVKVADQFVSLLENTAPGETLTETVRWSLVGMLAPMCGSEQAALKPIVTALFSSVKEHRSIADEPTPSLTVPGTRL